MNWLQKALLKGVDLRDVFPSYSEKANGGVRQPFTANVLDKYGLGYDALSKKDYIAEFRNWPYACVNARAESLGNIKLRLIDKASGDEVYDHEILTLLEKPNPFETRFDFFYGTQAYKDLDGNSFWYLAREGTDGKGAIREMFLLKPDKVKLVLNDSNPLTVDGYVYTQADGTRVPFKPEEILHQRMFNPNALYPFPHRGMGIIQAAAYAIDTDNESRKWNLAFFRNSARPDGVLYMEGEGVMRPEEFKRVTEEFEERHRGSESSNKLSILSGGMKYETVSSTHTEMDFYNQRVFGRDEILSMFKVPKTVIGIADDVNRANADAAIYVYNLLTIKPLMQRLVDYLNTFLLPLIDDSGKYYLDFHSPISEDRSQLLEEYQTGVDVWLTKNEIREREGLPPVEGGDVLYVPAIDMAVGSVNENGKKAINSKIKAGAKKRAKAATKTVAVPKTEGEKAVAKFMAKLPESKSFTKLDAELKTAHIKDWNQKMTVRTNGLKKDLHAYFDDQEKEVMANLKDEMKGLDPAEFHLKGMSDILFDYDDAVSVGISMITPFIKDYIKQSGTTATKLAGGDVFDSSTTFITNWEKNRAQYFADSINTTTRDALSKTIKEGIDNSETLSDISRRVAGVYDIAKSSRTDTIARTEVAAASNFGTVQAYKQAGIERQEWAVVSPEDHDCIENDGVIRDIGDAFPSGDTEAPVHPNCQCTTLPVFDEAVEDDDENQ